MVHFMTQHNFKLVLIGRSSSAWCCVLTEEMKICFSCLREKLAAGGASSELLVKIQPVDILIMLTFYPVDHRGQFSGGVHC